MHNRLKIALSFVLLGCLAALAYWIDGFDLFPEHNVRIVQPKKSHGPDIRCCMKPEVNKWVCIRDAEHKDCIETVSGDYNERVRKHMLRSDI